MCRNIKKLRRPNESPTDAELNDAALQFVRKVSGYHAPSKANQEVFDYAISEIAAATRTLFENLIIK